jgi:hypothetical protein
VWRICAEFAAAVDAALAPGQTFVQEVTGNNTMLATELTNALQEYSNEHWKAYNSVFKAPPPSK